MAHDPFGCHVFPDDIDDFLLPHFFRAMQDSLTHALQIHLWAYISTCRYKCHFCQFPTVIVNPQSARAPALFREVVDYNIQEARLWLAQLRDLGFSKLSFGAQSFSDRLIKGCGRLHSAEACYKVIRDARAGSATSGVYQTAHEAVCRKPHRRVNGR